MADAAQFAARCREAGLRVGVYVTSGTMLWELFFKEKPEAKDWAVLDSKGRPITYPWPPSPYRYFWNRNHPDAEAYHQQIVRFAVEEIRRTCCTSTTTALVPAGTPARWIGSAATSRPRSRPEQLSGMGAAALDGLMPPLPGTEGTLQCAWRDFCCASLAESYHRMTRYARSLRPDILMECNPGGISPRIEPPIDHGRLIPGGDAFWDEDVRPGYRDKTLQTRIRTYKIARRMQNSAFTYVTTPLEMAESMAFNLDCLGDVCWFEYGRIANYPGWQRPDRPGHPIVHPLLPPAARAAARRSRRGRRGRAAKLSLAGLLPPQRSPHHLAGRAVVDREPHPLPDPLRPATGRPRAVTGLWFWPAAPPCRTGRSSSSGATYSAGGRLCLIGPAATHDQWNARRARPALDDLPETALARAEIKGDSLAAVRRACGDGPSLSVRGPHGLCAELTEQADRRMVHLVNYRAGEPARGVEVRLRIPQDGRSARSAWPARSTRRTFRCRFGKRPAKLTFTVPEIRTYEIAVVEL